jgi:hypothetical protein
MLFCEKQWFEAFIKGFYADLINIYLIIITINNIINHQKTLGQIDKHKEVNMIRFFLN